MRSFGPADDYAAGDPHSLALADIDSDGRIDVLVSNLESKSVSVWTACR